MQANACDVLILAGGRGTRLAAAVPDCPKVLAAVNGRPFLTFLLEALDRAGLRRAILCTGWQAAQVEQTLGSRYAGISLAYSPEPAPLGTAGALRLALAQVHAETVLILNGDSFVDVDHGAALAWFRSTRPRLGLVLAWVPDTRRFGRVETAGDGIVLRFEEKGGPAAAGYINAGVYLTSAATLETIPAGVPYSLETQWLPSFAPGSLRGLPCHGRFIDIGTPASYRAAAEFFR